MHRDDATSQRLDFVRTLDALKGITRRTKLLDGSRYENTAEHSWHLAMMALSLAPEADEDIDVTRVVELLLCHDIVEIDADDTFIYDVGGRETKRAREEAAADRIFAQLPGDEGLRLRAAWDEYESGTTAEAWFARGIDRFQPLLLNMSNKGGSWLEHRIRADQVLTMNRGIAAGSLSLWERAQHMVDEAVERGWLQPAAGEARPDAPGLPAVLVTERLRLRWARLGDAGRIFDAYCADPEVTQFLTFEPHETPATVESLFLRDTLPRLGRGEEYVWVLEMGDEMIGTIAARPTDHGVELGYAMGKAWWGRGLMAEAIQVVTSAVFSQTDHDRVWAYTAVENVASARVLGKSGFAEEGTIRAWRRREPRDRPSDVRFFARLRTD